jgi:hypothetical protein
MMKFVEPSPLSERAAIARKLIETHRSGTFVRFTQAGADLFV